MTNYRVVQHRTVRRQSMPRKQSAANTATQKVEADPFRESAETDHAKDPDQPRLDYSAGGIDNTTDIITSDRVNDDGSIAIHSRPVHPPEGLIRAVQARTIQPKAEFRQRFCGWHGGDPVGEDHHLGASLRTPPLITSR